MGGRNLFGFVENNPLNQIDLNGQFAFVVIPIGIGIGITVNALVLGIHKISVNYQGYKNNDSFCCNLRSAAENCGLDLDSQMIDSYPGWYRDPKVKLKTYLYCTYCIECSFAEISKVTMELSKTLIEVMPNTSITGPISTSGSDFIAQAINEGLAKAGDVFVKDSAYYDGSKKEVSFFMISNPPCDWNGVCEGYKPSVMGFY